MHSTKSTTLKQWWKRSSGKKILLLLVWQVLFKFSWGIRASGPWVTYEPIMILSQVVSFLSPPFVIWLTDKTFGRYEMVKFGAMMSFTAGIFLYFTILFEKLLKVISFCGLMVTLRIGNACFLAAMLPFLTDQIIGATSDELSAVVQWYVWGQYFGWGTAQTLFFIVDYPNSEVIGVGIVCVYAIPLALIIISDCFCQQWLDRTHKVTNPIKLIIQVLNYTRKHRYPERRSAFTYIDEEHPSRIDFGKDKFGGPFTEEEVEDVKTVLRLIPLIICASFFRIADETPVTMFESDYYEKNSYNDYFFYTLEFGLNIWLVPIVLIPLYRFFLRRFFHRYTPSLLKSLGISLLLYLVGYILLEVSTIKGVIVTDDVHRYLTCSVLNNATVRPDFAVKWYFEIGQYLLMGIARTIYMTSIKLFIIAQSPEKMKGLVLGISFAVLDLIKYISGQITKYYGFNLCYDFSCTAVLTVSFVAFLILSKRYTLRERNREINIQAIVEEHYERYMDQEEEYMREQHY